MVDVASNSTYCCWVPLPYRLWYFQLVGVPIVLTTILDGIIAIKTIDIDIDIGVDIGTYILSISVLPVVVTHGKPPNS